ADGGPDGAGGAARPRTGGGGGGRAAGRCAAAAGAGSGADGVLGANGYAGAGPVQPPLGRVGGPVRHRLAAAAIRATVRAPDLTRPPVRAAHPHASAEPCASRETGRRMAAASLGT